MKVLLRSNADVNLVFFELLAFRQDIDAYDACMRAKVPLPHLKGSATPNANFKKRNRLGDELAKVTLIDGKIVLPFVDDSAVIG
jgi:hypothetical protein